MNDRVEREKAKEYLDDIRGTDERLHFEDGIGDGWIQHQKDDEWLVRMSVGHSSTFSEDFLLEEMQTSPITVEKQ